MANAFKPLHTFRFNLKSLGLRFSISSPRLHVVHFSKGPHVDGFELGPKHTALS